MEGVRKVSKNAFFSGVGGALFVFAIGFLVWLLGTGIYQTGEAAGWNCAHYGIHCSEFRFKERFESKEGR